MPSPVFRDAPYWTQNIVGALVARAGLSDVSDSSVMKTLASATGQALSELSYNCANLSSVFNIDTAAGTDLDRRALDIVPGTLKRIPAQPASASLTFTRGSSGAAVTIPQATNIKDLAGNVFATNQAATIPSGQTFIAGVAATAQLPGTQANVGAGALSTFGSRPPGIDSVTNPAAATGGSSAESDPAFRQRIRMYVSGIARGTESALVAAVLGAQNPDTGDTILYASVEEDASRPGRAILYIADAAGTNEALPTAVSGENVTASRLGPPAQSAQGGEVQLGLMHKPVATSVPVSLTSSSRGTLAQGQTWTLNEATGVVTFSPALTRGEAITASYSYYTGLLAIAQKIVDGDPGDRLNYPGIRAAGTQVVVTSPQVLIEPINATLTVDPAYTLAQVEDAARAAIASLMVGLPIGANLLVAELVAATMAVPGVVNVTFSSPASDILVSPGQLVRPPVVLSQIELH